LQHSKQTSIKAAIVNLQRPNTDKGSNCDKPFPISRQKQRTMLTVIIAEAALETIPKPLWGHPLISRDAARQGREPRWMLLDRSYHHRAMRRLRNPWKRGRPDISHLCLLEAFGSPLNREGRLTTIIHTLADLVLEFDPSIRLPRNYLRFKGLMEQAIRLRRAPPTGKPLITVTERTLSQLLEDIQPTLTLALTTLGKVRTIEDVAEEVAREKKPVVLVGGFPAGHFSQSTASLADETACIYPEVLDAWIVVSRIIYEYEKAIGLS